MTRPISPAAAMFKGASGNTMVGDVYGEQGPPVLLLHGGGQTRHAWKKTGDLVARKIIPALLRLYTGGTAK